MSFSLNEVEATAKRAARGAGYDWGVAEEAGKATRWLCAQGLDGATELARVLECGFASNLVEHVPKHMEPDWAGGKDLCPLMTGALLSDCSHFLQSGPRRIRYLATPAVLLPFAAQAARGQSAIVTVIAGDFFAATDGTQLVLENECPAHASVIEVALGDTLTNPRALKTRAMPDPAAWNTLNCFAHRTYAPATEESRLLGAGAGLSDND
ncbi:DUF3726 domain-containing protein [Ruegeria arenilitoris]|uniref:DUF3726 domain-containing protein n=1 Tax=Ruegeria arenilitoris TaxID=1173585 RepID=UPI00147ED387|nr:DUF3726 domain-containing protein [Ruegeria arenilitoris]